MDLCNQQPVDFANAIKFVGSDDEFFGGSTTDASVNNCGEFTELSGSEDADVGKCMSVLPALSGMTMMPQMAVPMQSVPSCAMPMSPQGAQMYCLTVTPDGTQMLVPMSASQVPAWGMPVQQVQPQPAPQENLALPDFAIDAGHCPGSLEARAAALSAYAAEVKAEARKAKQAAVAAARRGRTFTDGTNPRSERTASDSTPRWADMADQCFFADEHESIPNDDRTTLMFRNLPNNYNRSTLLQMLDSEGFKATYNLVYLPTDFRNFAGFGYAFVNFVSHEDAKKAKSSFQGFARWRVPSRKTCDVVWSGPVQGLQAHTERYRNSPVMHDSVPDEYKPAVFVDGVRIAFPAPTKRIRPPRVRRNSAGDGAGIAAPVPDAFTQVKRSGRGKNL